MQTAWRKADLLRYAQTGVQRFREQQRQDKHGLQFKTEKTGRNPEGKADYPYRLMAFSNGTSGTEKLWPFCDASHEWRA
jgi:hypothetical protein